MLMAASGCGVAAYKPDGAVNTSMLAREKKALALLYLDNTRCNDGVNAILATPSGDGYRMVADVVRPLLGSTNVSEIELNPGEYHLVQYTCTNLKSELGRARRVKDTLGKFEGIYTFRESYASFRVEAGEIVNVGSLAVRVITLPNIVGVEVEDWPTWEVDLFRKERPTLYAQMKTRLMTVTKAPPAPR